MSNYNVSIYDLIPQSAELESDNLGDKEGKGTALKSGHAIVLEYKKQGWESFLYTSGDCHAWLLVKPDSALFKLIEVSKT